VKNNCKFQPLSFSWVAIHPNPKGIVQFIGGALFGTFPTLFYDFLLKTLFNEGYTIIALPFRFTFDHWSVSLQLLREQYVIRKALIEKVKQLNHDPQIYLDEKNYHWIGHSLGCKYIILLEILSEFEEMDFSNLQWQKIWEEIKPSLLGLDDRENRKIIQQAKNIQEQVIILNQERLKVQQEVEQLVNSKNKLKELFIKDERSLLIAPDFSDTNSAIPIALLANLIDKLGWGAKPTKQQTQALIQASPLFSLTSILSFERDMIAGNLANSSGNSDVAWLVNNLDRRLMGVREIANTFHLEPHGKQINEVVVDFLGAIIVWLTALSFAPFIPFSLPAKAFFNETRKPIIKTLAARRILEQTILDLLDR
jgi:hypothetical protein